MEQQPVQSERFAYGKERLWLQYVGPPVSKNVIQNYFVNLELYFSILYFGHQIFIRELNFPTAADASQIQHSSTLIEKYISTKSQKGQAATLKRKLTCLFSRCCQYNSAVSKRLRDVLPRCNQLDPLGFSQNHLYFASSV
ncbi:Hypothetical_protein [Hexamita inflata]|uniref:Hypothetical_protein n=1 Tax=Hexamita inflata TaxID=28002 RepID=A0AA86RM09_9EUKA|nr:Hypothetical protein HINF_LOCUS62017 [Hexamita inflata]